MKSHNIAGGGGIQLHLVERGNSRGAQLYSSMAFRSVRSPGTGS